MVAKYQVHLRSRLFVTIDVVELVRSVAVQPAAAIAAEMVVQGPAKDSFIGCHPANTLFRGDGNRFFRDTALRRPQSLGADAEVQLVRLQRAAYLFAGVLGALE